MGSAEISGRRLGRDVVAQLGGMLLNLALGLVVTALIARTLGDRGYGQWTTIFALLALTTFVTDFGLRQVVVRQIAEQPAGEAKWLGSMFSLMVALSLPATALCAGLVLLLARSDAMRVAGLILSLTLLLSPSGALMAVFQVRVRNHLTQIIQLGNGVAWAAVVVVVSLLDAGMVSLGAGFLAVTIATAVVSAHVALRVVSVRPRLRGSRANWGPLARLAVPVGLASLLILLYGRIDQVLVFTLAGSRQAGLYGAAYRVLDQAQFIPIAIMTTLLPVITAAYRDGSPRLATLVQRAFDYLAVAGLGGLALALAAAGPLVRLVFGQEFGAASPALPVLMGAFVLICFGYLAGHLVIVLGLQRRTALYALVALGVNVGLNLLLIPGYGFMAAAWVTLVTELASLAMVARLVVRTLGVRPRLGTLGRIAAAGASMGALVGGARAAGAPALALLGTAAVAYPLLLLALGAVRLDDLRALLSRRGAA